MSIFQAVRKRKINPYSIAITAILYVVNKKLLVTYTSGLIHLFCSFYFNDLICPFLFLGISQIMLIWAGCELKSYISIVFLGMAGGIIWEFVGPIINPKSVTDIWDLACYFIGSNGYWFLMKQTNHRVK